MYKEWGTITIDWYQNHNGRTSIETNLQPIGCPQSQNNSFFEINAERGNESEVENMAEKEGQDNILNEEIDEQDANRYKEYFGTDGDEREARQKSPKPQRQKAHS